MNKLELYYPLNLPFNINQKYGENLNSLYKEIGMLGHNGIDYSAVDGTPVYATHNGTVTYAGLDGSNGLLVVIKTDEQFAYKDGQAFFKTLYGHLKTGSIVVTAGQKVKAGDKIAEADNTGASTGSHLHFGLKPVQQGEQDWVWWNIEQGNGYNGAIDPMPYMNGKYPKDAKIQPSKEFLALMQAAKDYQISKGVMDFAQEADLRRIEIGTKTLSAIKKDKKLWN